ncbi:MAG: TldD/PmbA family protein [Clostridia bacterium]|nr:TldD/PmbA family protein [Clostridia bacterium]
MRKLEECAAVLEKKLSARKTDKFAFTLSETEGQEFNLENGEFSLLRTVVSNHVSLKIIQGGRMGSVSGTDISDEALEQIIADAFMAAESAVPDEMHDIAPFEHEEHFAKGCESTDLEGLFSRTQELKLDIEREYPLIRLMLMIASQSKSRSVYRNSNGTAFECRRGGYSVSLEFSAGDGDRTTGIDAVGFVTDDLSTPFIDRASVRQHLRDTSSRIETRALTEKFNGSVVFTPECLAQFLSMTIGNYASGGVILDGTSLWLNKIGEKVACETLTVRNCPWDPRIIHGECWTGDGFRTENIDIIDHGVLKTHLLSLYVANKTGRPVTKNSDDALIVLPGDQPLRDIISGIDKGIVMGDFSGGQPGTNGDFSGVAKNAFLIENGKIAGAISETMVSGNLGEMLMHIRALSRETVEDGSMSVPYMAVDGIVISGK